MHLENIPRRTNRKTDDKRIGRGYGSGVGGHTVGRGTKRQKSRSGHKSTLFLEGGNRPFFRRVPKYRGFTNNAKVEYQPVNITIIDKNYNEGDVVSIESLKEKALIRKRTTKAKILGFGELSKLVNVSGVALSEVAKEKVLAKGGKIE